MIHALRWFLFKQLSWIGWVLCPEPERTVIRFTYDKAVGQLGAHAEIHKQNQAYLKRCDMASKWED